MGILREARAALESWIAWRHLRARGGRRWPRPLALLGIYVALVGGGFLVWAAESSAGVELGGRADLWSTPIADIAGLLGLLTLGAGLLTLCLAVLAAYFNLLSAIIILSVAQGCMALVVVLSLMTGLEQDLQDKIIRQRAEIRISDPQGEPFGGYPELIAALAELPEVAASSPYAEGEVMLRSPYNRSGGTLIGILPEAHAAVTGLQQQIETGDYRFLSEPERGPWEALDRLQRAREVELQRALGEGAPGDADAPEAVEAVEGEPAGDPTGAGAIEGDEDGEGATEDLWGESGGAWEDPSARIPELRAQGLLPASGSPGEGAGQGGELLPDARGAKSRILTEELPEDLPEDLPEPSAAPDSLSVASLVPLIVGTELAEELSVPLGARIQVITPIGRMTPSGEVPSLLAVRVVALFYSGNFAYDHQNVYAPLDRVQALLRLGDAVHGIDVKLIDSDRLDPALAAIRRLLGELGRDDLRVESWRMLHGNLFSAMFLEKVAMFIGLLFVVLVAAFGILATNLMSVLDKGREIAILKAMGASDRRIARVFMLEGLIVGVVGAALGIGVGLLFCSLLARQGLPLPAENFYNQRLPVVVSGGEVAMVGVLALVIVWLSSVHPARIAARMRPVDGLRLTE